MAAPVSFVDYKLERAIVAYLINQGAGSRLDTFASMDVGTRKYPNTTVTAVNGQPEPKLTGNYRTQVWITVKGSAATNPTEPNKPLPVVLFSQRVQTIWDACMQSDDGCTLKATASDITDAGRALAVPVDASPEAVLFAQNNADMADFTCQEWDDNGFGQGEANEEGCAWVRVLMFSALACSSNVD